MSRHRFRQTRLDTAKDRDRRAEAASLRAQKALFPVPPERRGSRPLTVEVTKFVPQGTETRNPARRSSLS